MDSPDLPQRFGPYVVLERIGDGGMAEIFLAKMVGYSGFEKHVALKKILPPYSQHASFARMLIHEAKLAARIQHFNVVQVLDLGEIDSQVYIAMEYVRGRDLAALLSNTYRRKERIPLGVSLCIAIEFLTGLDYAHRLAGDDGAPLGLIHRDISPQNVLISFEGEVKLTDFGIARVIAGESDMRLPGNLHGKFGYMSPEQVDGLRLDQRSDVFSAGVVLHEMLTGQRLFRGKTPQETVELVRATDVKVPSATNPECPPDIDRIVMKSLARDREQRYQTVGAMLGELSRVTAGLQLRASRRDVAVYMKRQFGATASDPATRRGQATAVSSASGRVPIGQVLMHRLNAVSLDQIEIALAEQRANGGRLGEILVEAGVINEDVLAAALALQAGLPLAETVVLDGEPPSLEVIARFPATSARAGALLPVGLAGHAATLAVADPYDTHSVLEAKIILGVSETKVTVASRARIMDAITRWYGTASADIPVEPPTEYQPTIASAPSLNAPVAQLVLIADPDAALVERLAARVREEGYEVMVAHDGKTARTLTRERIPAVAVIDVGLPGIDGYNVLLDLRARELDCAVFITSSRADEFQEAKALELGADDFIAKPWSDEVTTSKIRREMQKRTASRTSRSHPTASQFTGVSGSLADMTVLDIIQSLELGRKSAEVTINYEDGRGGELLVRRGELKGANAAGTSGEAAFYALVKPGPGAFRIEYLEPSGTDNISRPNTFLMLEALRRIDEQEHARMPVAPQTWSSKPDLARLVGDLEMDTPPRAPQPKPATPSTPVPPMRVPPPSSLGVAGRPNAPQYAVPAISTPARGVPAPAPSQPPMTPVPLVGPTGVPLAPPHGAMQPPQVPPASAWAARPPPPLLPPDAPTVVDPRPMIPPNAPTVVDPRAQQKPLARVALQRMSTSSITAASPLPPPSTSPAIPAQAIPPLRPLSPARGVTPMPMRSGSAPGAALPPERAGVDPRKPADPWKPASPAKSDDLPDIDPLLYPLDP